MSLKHNFEFIPTLQFEQAYFFMLLEYLKKSCWEGFKNTQTADSLKWLSEVKISNTFYDPPGIQLAPFMQEGETEKYCIDLHTPIFHLVPDKNTSLELYVEVTLPFQIGVGEIEKDVGVRNQRIPQDDKNFTPVDLGKNANQDGYQMLPYSKLSYLRSWLITALIEKRGYEFFELYPSAKDVCFYCNNEFISEPGGMNFEDNNGSTNSYYDRFLLKFNARIPTHWYGSAYTLVTINTDTTIKFNKGE